MAASMDTDQGMPSSAPAKMTIFKEMNQTFLDQFWKLADENPTTRLRASIEIVKYCYSGSDAEVKYAVERLVQGLASFRPWARHGFFIGLVGLLSSLGKPRIPNELIFSSIEKSLSPKGIKGERVELYSGCILAYGALVKSSRIHDNAEAVKATKALLQSSKQRSVVEPLTYSFIKEMVNQVPASVFQEAIWPSLVEELTISWEELNLESLYLLCTIQTKFPKLVSGTFKNHLGYKTITHPNCLNDLAKLLIRCKTHGQEHPFFDVVIGKLSESGNLILFWNEHIDPAIESATKATCFTVLSLLKCSINHIEPNKIPELLSHNVVSCLVTNSSGRHPLSKQLADEILMILQDCVTKENVESSLQVAILEKLLSTGAISFDKHSDSRFIVGIIPSLRKESVMKLVEIYRDFISGKENVHDKQAVILSLSKLLSHPAMQGENYWKSCQLVFLLKGAYFDSHPKTLASSFRDGFYRGLNNPCKKLQDLCSVLMQTVNDIQPLVVNSKLSDKVRSSWNAMKEYVDVVQNQKESRKKGGNWVNQVFQGLFLCMGFHLFREPDMAGDIIEELKICHEKATLKKQKDVLKNSEEPYWLEVVVEILLSLLSRDRHLLRSVVISVWSLLANHVTRPVLQHILDVIDPTKKEKPLVDINEQKNGFSDEEEDEDSNDETSTDEDDNAGMDDSEEESLEKEEGEHEDDDAEDEEEEEGTVTDKLRSSIREALGDAAALTDTESIDIDDLSDGEMERLDRSLGAAFKQFRRTQNVRKNAKKLPRDETTLMHFRLRCMDLVEVLLEKEITMENAIACLLPLLAVLEVTVKDPLQKSLADRARSILRKVSNLRKFTHSENVDLVDLTSILEILFSKPLKEPALVPYISDELIFSTTFILRCILNIQRERVPATQSKKDIELDKVFELYQSSLSKFFSKRDSPIPYGIFLRALQFPWPDAAFLSDSLVSYAFGESVLMFRKLQALQLLTTLFHNRAALSCYSDKMAHLLQSILQHATKVIEEATSDAKPKYFQELFNFLRTVFHHVETTERYDLEKYWSNLDKELDVFQSRISLRHNVMKKSFHKLTETLKVSLTSKDANLAKKKSPEKIQVTFEQGTSQKEINHSDGLSEQNSKSNGLGRKKKPTKRQFPIANECMEQTPSRDITLDTVSDNVHMEISSSGSIKKKKRKTTREL